MRKRFLFTLGLILLIVTTACGTVVRFDDPAATQAVLQQTVVAIQSTVTALENAEPVVVESEAITEPTPQVIVVTATPIDTPVPTATPPPTATPLPTNIPPPTATEEPTPEPETISQDEPTAQAEPIIIVVTATPEPVVAPSVYENAPVLIAPQEGDVVEEGREILLQWSWNGLLNENEHFDVKIRPDGQSRSAYVAWENGEGHNLLANLSPGRYYWSVQVLSGYYQNNSGHPEDRVFKEFISPESEARLLVVAEKPPRNPRSQSQADPPGPFLPFGVILGGLAFSMFASVVHKQNVIG